MSIFATIAEQRIQDAIRRGELDDLSLQGQPLPREDLTEVPEELRMAYKILKNAGYVPEEITLQKEIVSLRSLLEACTEDAEEHAALSRRLSLRQLQFDLLMEKNGRNPALQEYSTALTRRLLTGQCR